jgi:hypothetical protein
MLFVVKARLSSVKAFSLQPSRHHQIRSPRERGERTPIAPSIARIARFPIIEKTLSAAVSVAHDMSGLGSARSVR